MTTKTTTTALADLDRLIERGTNIAGWIDKFGAKADAVDVLQLVALARRAAQPVAISQVLRDMAMGNIPESVARLLMDAACAIEPYEIAAPSPQVAEGAAPDLIALAKQAGYSFARTTTPGVELLAGNVEAHDRLMNFGALVAASRRAEEENKPLHHFPADHWANKVHATPAPASAGQAAPAPIAKLLGEIESIADELEADATNYEGDFADTVKGCAEELRKIVAQSAEGAAAEQPSAQENSNA